MAVQTGSPIGLLLSLTYPTGDVPTIPPTPVPIKFGITGTIVWTKGRVAN